MICSTFFSFLLQTSGLYRIPTICSNLRWVSLKRASLGPRNSNADKDLILIEHMASPSSTPILILGIIYVWALLFDPLRFPTYSRRTAKSGGTRAPVRKGLMWAIPWAAVAGMLTWAKMRSGENYASASVEGLVPVVS